MTDVTPFDFRVSLDLEDGGAARSGTLDRLLAFWGKARPESPSKATWHPLVFHCLDVAAVGLILVERLGILPVLVSAFGDRWPGSLGMVLALHDLGKLSRPFQAQSPEHWPEAVLGPYKPPSVGLRHDALGLLLLQCLLNPEEERRHPLGDWNKPTGILLAPVVGHHGRPVSPPDVDFEKIFGPVVKAAGHDFLELMTTLFQPDFSLLRSKERRAILNRASWDLAGLTVLADWIGSNQNWFPYRPDLSDPAEYWNDHALPQARHAVEQAGLIPARPGSSLDYRVLIGGHSLSPVQRWAETVALPDGPVLVLIEDMTGSGKTEAALILVHLLLASGRARGFYVALPTMATANAMYSRLAACYRWLFDSADTPSLALAHSATTLHQGFRNSVPALATAECSNNVPALATAECSWDTPEKGESGGDEASATCAAWLADSRRKCFLADVGVGTIDQALLAVLPAKYQALRLLGLGRQVLVIDEAHAYDVYMGTELERLLKFQAALGGSAVVLSATLPQTKRQALAEAFARGLGATVPALENTDYPLTTLVAAAGVWEEACATRPGLARTLAVSRLADADEAVRRIVEAEQAGAAVAWVRNTVDDACAAVALLEAQGVPAVLFHARFAMGDRLAIEDAVIKRFGKDGDPANRRGVLVATQVIEQSLDLDFDLMVSDLAPIDLLLQRAGRLWRHDRGARPVAGPYLLVLAPDPGGTVESTWCRAAQPGTAAIYQDHGVLWLTADTLFKRPAWRIPEEVRGLVEAVYRADALDRIPLGLKHAALKVDGDNRAAGCLADINLLKVEAGYHGEHVGWAEDTRTPTRLGEETTTLRLARWHDGALQPWCEDQDPHRAWALSEVSVRAFRARATPKLPAAQAAAANRARATWTRHDAEKLLVPLEPDAEGGWRGQVIGEKKETLSAIEYSCMYGLKFLDGKV